MTAVTKHVATVAGLAALPAVVASKLVTKALHGPDFLDPQVPPPCWVPKELPDRHAVVKSGATGKLAVWITNLGPAAETYEVLTNTSAVIVDKPLLVLGPLEQATVTLELAIPAGTPHGILPPVVVTVNGCQSYRFRWLLKAVRFPLHHHHGLVHHHHAHGPLHHHPLHHSALVTLGLNCGCWHHVDIHDQPDFQHHWYDHFSTECGCGGHA